MKANKRSKPDGGAGESPWPCGWDQGEEVVASTQEVTLSSALMTYTR